MKIAENDSLAIIITFPCSTIASSILALSDLALWPTVSNNTSNFVPKLGTIQAIVET